MFDCLKGDRLKVSLRAALLVTTWVLALGIGNVADALAQVPDAPAQVPSMPALYVDDRPNVAPPLAQGELGAAELNAAREAALRGQWQEALERYREVLEQYPAGQFADDATFWSAFSLNQLGRYEEAVEWATRLLNQYPDSDLRSDGRVVRFEAAEILARRGNVDYERYLREEAEPRAPRAAPTPPQAPGAAGQAAPPVADFEADLRVMALDALIGLEPEQAWPIIQRIMGESDNSELRTRGVWLLGEIGTDEAFALLVETARSDQDPEVRSAALFWVAQSEAHADQAMDLLIDMLNSNDQEERNVALFGLGQSTNPAARQAMEEVARDVSRDAELRAQSLFWLGQQGEGSLALLRDIAMNDPDLELRNQALFGLAQIDTPQAGEFLLEIASGDGPLEFRSNAIFHLGQRNDVRGIDILIELWSEVDDVEIRNQLLFALAQADDERAIDHLIAVAKNSDEDNELRQQAIMWLGQSENPKAVQALLDIIGGGTR